jgi:hypothetical protein
MTAMALLRVGDASRKKLDEIRGEIAAALESIEELHDAPLPAADVVRQVMSALGSKIDHARNAVRSYMWPGTSLPLTDVDPWALMALLLPDFEKRLASLLAVPSSKQPTSLPVRQKKGAELKAKIASLERVEEVEICRLESLGYVVERRLDVPIETLLAVWNDAT